MLIDSLLKPLAIFVDPLAQVLSLLLLGLYLSLRGRSRPALVIFCTSTAWLWLCSMPYVAGSLMAPMERDYPPVAASSLPQADAIVLLGDAQNAPEVTMETTDGAADHRIGKSELDHHRGLRGFAVAQDFARLG